MGPMLSLSLKQMAGRRKIAIIVILAALPIGLAVLLHTLVGDDGDFNEGFSGLIIDGLLLGVILPIVVMTLATSAFGNELEDRTLNVLILKPVRRISIVLPKYLASVIVAGGLLVTAGVAIVLIALSGEGITVVLAIVASVLVGVLAYASFFTWMGLMSSKALGFALVYVFLWEQLLTRFIRGIRYFSVREYSLSILHGMDDVTFESFGPRVIEFEAAIVAAVIVIFGFLFLTLRRLNRMDIP